MFHRLSSTAWWRPECNMYIFPPLLILLRLCLPICVECPPHPLRFFCVWRSSFPFSYVQCDDNFEKRLGTANTWSALDFDKFERSLEGIDTTCHNCQSTMWISASVLSRVDSWNARESNRSDDFAQPSNVQVNLRLYARERPRVYKYNKYANKMREIPRLM